MQRHFDNAEELCQYVADLCPNILLSFSAGKDSIGAWIQVKRYFKSIQLFYMYLIPDLEFVDQALRYYERLFDCPIIQMPHPSLYRQLRSLTLQAPQNCRFCEERDFPSESGYNYDSLAREVMHHLKLPRDTFVAHGTRASDSIMRRTSIKRHGSLNPGRRTFMPVFDWNVARLEQEIREADIGLPVDYLMFGRSLDGIDCRFLTKIKERFPDDYARILEWFPMAELEVLREEWKLKHASGKK